MKPEKRVIRLARGAKIGPEAQPIYGWAEVEAECLGGLAVHKALEGEPFKWAISHAASGMHIRPLCAATKARALANMRAALELGFDWSRGERETLDALRMSRGVVDACRMIGAN